MRKLLGLGLAVLLGSSLAGTARAATLEWTGTFRVLIGDFKTDAWVGTGSGVATVDTGTTAGHLNSLRLGGGGISVTGTTIQTDPENPSLSSLKIDTAQPLILGKGTLAPFSGGPLTQNKLTGVGIGPGNARYLQCILLPGCGNYVPIPVTLNGTRGAGIGGTITVQTFAKQANALKLSVVGTPWTIGAAVITGVPNRITLTQNGVITNRFTIHTTRTVTGFRHGPASATSSSTVTPITSAVPGGVIQVVTPTRVDTSLAPPNDFLPVFGIVTLKFIPEPGMILLLGSGVAGLVVLGRHRMRR
jgi:hypothetical protein